MNGHTLRIGLTGGVASGKTQVSDTLAQCGATIIDTDVLARMVVAPGAPALDDIAQTFGPQFIDADGALDRTAMRAHVFADPAARQTLEAITHPRIGAAVQEALTQATGDYVVIVIPLLDRSALRAMLDRTLVVDCDPAQQLARLLDRDGGELDTAWQMLTAQASRERRLALADDVIDNAGSLAALRARTRRLHRYYRYLSGSADGRRND